MSANTSTETVMENIDFSFVLEEVNVPTSSNLTENKHTDISIVKNTDLHEADPGTMMEAAGGENSIRKEIIATDTSTVANHVVAKVCSFPLKLYCPFCCSNNSSASWLKGHIRNEHATHLERISTENNINSLHSCYFCHARFYTDDLVILHIGQHHQDNVIAMFQESEPNKYIVCGFCPYKVLNKYKLHLLAHVEENHFTEFKIYMGQKCSKTAKCKKLQYTLDMKDSRIPNLHALFMKMSIKGNKVGKDYSLDQSEYNSSSKFINQNTDQLLDADGNFIDKLVEIKNIGTGRELPIRRKLRFDLPETNRFKKSSKENISCSTNTKVVTKHTPKPSKIKPVSAWKSFFSFKRKQIKSRKSISKLVTSTPDAVHFQTGIRRPEYDKDISVIKLRHIAKDKPTASINEDRCISKKYSEADTQDDTSEVLNKDLKNVISKTLHPAALEIEDDTFCSCASYVEMLKQFQCAMCFDGFVKNIDLLTHARQQHTGPLKLLRPSYKCGQCEAKFYKNSYLVKHCRFHHTPRCLTNELPS
ncbi:uncharacterized protein LOC111865412 isoform X1 [Cryptotermes secundus]|uniref:uncharacterized protein LOC111865412 isoform X1 n=2 Tax=Cryptotermes secundus TaxID=105785 RepID=UPI001454DB37|nr:uncharacterized protein LOC111865412 isoform X1 [Cryptotermes secundus]XP_033607705.1 uncharacterized protein LOC111865412 isoform X1 [Cryptotermes secundus]XP_033607706.1 uncharacterized protein LOC111865412 isoform X1 [Cryptotermes secundus]